MARVSTGLDLLADEGFLRFKGMRTGLLANQAAVNCRLEHAAFLCHRSSNLSMLKLFAPEHGFWGRQQDMAAVGQDIDPSTKLPVISLYGTTKESLSPIKEDLADLDLLLVDLPDIGSRYYTFAQTLAYCMQTAAKTGTKIAVLDRPNPVNGNDIEGAWLEASCQSFCGYAPVANRHGLTLGELAQLMKTGFGEGSGKIAPINCDLEVVQLRGWNRKMYFDETELPWILPSPNMPTLETALVYPGTCLFEATNISEGRGTTRPFEIFGAPYINGELWQNEVVKLNLGLEGAALRPLNFLPQFHKWAQIPCGGLQIHITDRKVFKPFRLALALLITAAGLYPEHFALRSTTYEFIDSVPALDLLFGSSKLRSLLGLKSAVKQEIGNLVSEISAFEQWYSATRKEFLLY